MIDYEFLVCDKGFIILFIEEVWVLRQKQENSFYLTSIECDLIFFSEAPSSFVILLFLFRVANIFVASFAEYDSLLM
jgi:hypothetical protein